MGMQAKRLTPTPPAANPRVPAGGGEVEERRSLDPKSSVITSGILTSVWLRRRSSLPANQAQLGHSWRRLHRAAVVIGPLPASDQTYDASLRQTAQHQFVQR